LAIPAGPRVFEDDIVAQIIVAVANLASLLPLVVPVPPLQNRRMQFLHFIPQDLLD
jgi:hypothetical protein